MSTRFRMSIAILLALTASRVRAQDLTGIWRDNTGGRYVVRQAGEEFCWTSEQNVFCGLRIGTVIAGSWLDLPTGRFRGNGRMVLQIESPNRLVKLRQTANYAASFWTREGSSDPVSPAAPAPQPTSSPQPPASSPLPEPAVPLPSPPSGGAGILDGGEKDWDYRALDGEYRNMTGRLIRFTCPPDRAPKEWRALYGTDVYTDDSVLCQAAVHAGKITTRGGTFTIEMLPGRSSYSGRPRNGVISANFGAWGGSFAFQQTQVSLDVSRPPSPAPAPAPAPAPRAEPSVIADQTAGRGDTPQAFSRQVGARVRYTCAPGGQYLNRVWGTDVYTLDSEICAAAIHAGLITAAVGGKFVVEIRAGQSAYRGSVRNGLTSWDYPEFPVSFSFVR